MAAQKILRSFGTSTAYTSILPASLAPSLGGKTCNVGAATASTTNRLRIYVKVKTGSITAPEPYYNGNKIYVWGFSGDGTRFTDGIADTATAGVVVKTAKLIGTIDVPKTTTAAALTLQGWFIWDNPGAFWTIGIGHDTGAALSATAGDHLVHTQTDDPELQVA